MQATPPYPDVPGDNADYIGDIGNPEAIRPRIMARSGQLVGWNDRYAVWCFGFTPGSDAANAFGVAIEGGGLLFVLATRRTGKVRETFQGWGLNMPKAFRKVVASK